MATVTNECSRAHTQQRPQGHLVEASIPIRQWINDTAQHASNGNNQTKESILRKTTVAYGIAELLLHAKSGNPRIFNDVNGMKQTSSIGNEIFNLDNFVVRLSCTSRLITEEMGVNSMDPNLKIEGINMILPDLSLKLIPPVLPNNYINENELCLMGKNMSFEMTGDPTIFPDNNYVPTNDSDLISQIGKDDALLDLMNDQIHDFPVENFQELSNFDSNDTCRIFASAGSHTVHNYQEEKMEPPVEQHESASAASCLRGNEINGARSDPKFATGVSEDFNVSAHLEEIQRGINDNKGTEVEESRACHLFGVLLYELFSNNAFLPCSKNGNSGNSPPPDCPKTSDVEEPSRKKSSTASSVINFAFGNEGQSNSGMLLPSLECQTLRTPLCELGFPTLISLLVSNLLECGWGEFSSDVAYSSLKEASEELHLLLEDPSRYLFHALPETGDGVGVHFKIKNDKLYGREKESSLISETLIRVILSGESEALFIGGYSGSGKTSLVKFSVKETTSMLGGFFLSQKFDEMSDSPLSIALSSFDNLCVQISKKKTPEEVDIIVKELKSVFGMHLSTLARVLPNIGMLSPQLVQEQPFEEEGKEINIHGIYFIIQRFMRVVSSKTQPIVLFLDDLQWSDRTSLNLIHAILSDTKGSNCFFFIGSHRENVSDGHSIYQFMNNLDTCNVLCTKVHLNGIEKKALNMMVSESLGLFPRLTRSLSDTLFHKTKGNPLFLLEFLDSLSARGLLRFSYRERRWVWNDDGISAERVTDNVCQLLSTKLGNLPENFLLALKVASCFGNKIDSSIVACLSSTAYYPTLKNELDFAVDQGYMDFDGLSYQFCHDKVRESSYNMIPCDDKDKFHANLGMILYESHLTTNEERAGEDYTFIILDQINRGKYLLGDKERIEVARLNYSACCRAMGNDFAAAVTYADIATELLPAGHWENFNFTRHLFLLKANAAYSCGRLDKAMITVEDILANAQCLEDKLDASFLMVSLQNAKKDTKKAYMTCADVLSQLGEEIPEEVPNTDIVKKAKKMKKEVKKVIDKDLLGLSEASDSRTFWLTRFYSSMSVISFYVKPQMHDYFACRLVEIVLQNGHCRCSSFGVIPFALVLCGNSLNDPCLGYKVGKMSFNLLQKYEAIDQMPKVYMAFYNFIAPRFEPIQSCADMLKRGFEIGSSIGDLESAFICAGQHIRNGLFGGINLSVLQKEADYYIRLFDQHSNSFCKMYVSLFQQTVAILLDKGEPAGFEKEMEEFSSKVETFSESAVFHKAIQCFWFGRYERCHHFLKKISFTDVGMNATLLFYSGIAGLHLVTARRKVALLDAAADSINLLKVEMDNCTWNYESKVKTLQAELFNVHGRKEDARLAYDAAIEAAGKCRLYHEQGLACELAGFHYKKAFEWPSAKKYFEQAKKCYSKWGAQLKVNFIDQQLNEARCGS